jgi:WD40 repeat protein
MRRSWSRPAAAVVAVTAAAACGPRAGDRGPTASADADRLPPGADLRLGDPRWRVPGSVDAIVFSPDEREVVVGSYEGGVLVVDVATGRRRLRVRDLGALSSLARVDDRRVIVAGWIEDDAGTPRPGPPSLIDVRTGRIDHRPGLARLATGEVAVAGEDLIVAGGHGTRLAVVAATGTVRRALDRSRGYGSLAVHGAHAIAVRGDATVGVWDVTTGARLAVFGAGNGGLAALSPDATLLAIGTWNAPSDPGRPPRYEVDVYRVAGGAKVATITHPCHFDAAAVSPDGARLALACETGTWVHALPSGAEVAAVPGTGAHVRVVAWSPSGRWLALGGNDAALHLVDTTTWRPVALGAALGGDVRALDVAADGRVLATGPIPGTGAIDVWDGATGTRLQHLAPGDGTSFAAAALGGPDELIVGRTTDAGGGTVLERRTPNAPARVAPVTSGELGPPQVGPIRLRADGTIAVVAGGALRVLAADLSPLRGWALAPRNSDPDFPRYPDVALSRDGTRAAIETGAGVELIELDDADAATRRIDVEVCGTIVELAFTGDRERLIAVGGNGGVYRLDATTGKAAAGIVLPGRPGRPAWLPSGEVVVLVDDVLYAWARTGELRRRRTPDVTALAAAPGGQHVYLGLADGTVVRARWSTLREQLEPTTAPAAGACESDDGDVLGGLLGSLGDGARGMLDNTDPHEDPIDAE